MSKQTNQTANAHVIDYSQNVVKNFLQQLSTALPSLEVLKLGVDAQLFESIWNQLGNQDIATVYLTVLMGKLLLMENKILQLVSNMQATQDGDSNGSVNTMQEEWLSVQEVIDQLKLGSHKYDQQHVLLQKRKETIKTKLRKVLIDTEETVMSSINNTNLTATTTSSTSVPLTPQKVERQFFSIDQILERSAIMNSIIYVSLFYRFDHQNASLLNLIDTWNKLRAQIQSQLGNMQIDTLTEEVRESLCPPVEALYKYIHFCCDFDSLDENDQIFPHPLNKYDPLTMAASYVYYRLQTVCRIGKFSENVLDEIVTLITRIVSSKQDPIKLRNVLHFVKIILPQLYIENDEKLKALMKVITPFFMEPLPIGGLVRDVLQLCKSEIAFKCSSMRNRFERAISRLKQKDGSVAEKRRVVNILFNPSSQYASYLADKFDLYAELPEEEIDNAKANLLLNMFEDAEKKSSDDLMKIPLEVLAKFYRQAANFYKKAEQENNRSSLAAAFSKLRNDIVSAAKESVSQKFVVRMKALKLPEIGFNVITLPNEEDMAKCQRYKKVYPLSSIYDILNDLVTKAKEQKPDEDKEAVLDIAIAGGSGTVQHVVHSIHLAQKNNIFDSINLRVYLIPLGEFNYLSSWLEKYDGWYSRHLHYPVLSPISLLPGLKTVNTTKEIEAQKKEAQRKLSVTKRGTMIRKTPVLGAPLKPPMKRDPVQLSTYKAPKKFMTPQKFMRTTLSDYFTDAIVPMPIYIYNAQCLTNEVIDVQSDDKKKEIVKQKSKRVIEYVSLAFCQRMEIGFLAEAVSFAKSEKLEGQSFDDIQMHKNFKYNGTQLTLSYVPMDPTGESNRTTEINEPVKTYNIVSIRSTTNTGDRGELAAPCMPWLEIYAEDFAQAQPKKKKTPKAPESNSTLYHVASISVESATAQQFFVVLDGELYGPFHKILINAATNTCSVMTFNEISL